MIQIDELTLCAGVDIPFQPAQIVIHQPTMREIAFINEENFWLGSSLLGFDKNTLTSEVKSHLSSATNFDILMSIVLDNNMGGDREKVELVLTLLFPRYQISLTKTAIILIDESGSQHRLDNTNYSDFQKILDQLLCTKKGEKEYNPSGDMAQKLADKFKKRKQELNKDKGQSERISVFSRYISILAVGQQTSKLIYLDYTPWMLFDEYNRFCLKEQYDSELQVLYAGGKLKDGKNPENWKKDMYTDE